jgi:hypothetical protein
MKTIYQGLSSRNSLTALKIRFPISRLPRPVVTIPGIPRLRDLHLENLDPLCYNDDVSLLISDAVALESLKLHFNPRIRRELELSVSMATYFGRLWASKRVMRLKHISFANLFSRHEIQLDSTNKFDRLETICTINCMDSEDPNTTFVDRTWQNSSMQIPELVAMKSMRTDRVHEKLSKDLFLMRGLEALYLVSKRDWTSISAKLNAAPIIVDGINMSPDPRNGDTPSKNSDITINGRGSNDSDSQSAPNDITSPIDYPPQAPLTKRNIELASTVIAAITKVHGSTLRKLLLFDTWNLGAEAMLGILSSCPHLEQVGLAGDFSNPEFPTFIRKCLRAAPKLRALRILFPPWSEVMKAMSYVGKAIHIEMMRMELARGEFAGLRYFAVGPVILLLGEMDENGKRDVKELSWDDKRVQAIEIFGLDNGDL